MSDKLDQLAKLNDLKNSGAITEDEFAEQKNKLLQSSNEPPKKKTILSLRSPKTWAIAIVAVVGYQAIKYGHAENVINEEANALRSEAYDKCISQFVSMLDLTNCSRDEWQRQDRRLNVAYKAALKAATDRNVLKAKQRAWIKMRDRECAGDADGGQAAIFNEVECLGTKTILRATELESMK